MSKSVNLIGICFVKLHFVHKIREIFFPVKSVAYFIRRVARRLYMGKHDLQKSSFAFAKHNARLFGDNPIEINFAFKSPHLLTRDLLQIRLFYHLESSN